MKGNDKTKMDKETTSFMGWSIKLTATNLYNANSDEFQSGMTLVIHSVTKAIDSVTEILKSGISGNLVSKHS